MFQDRSWVYIARRPTITRKEPISPDMLDTVKKACCYWKLVPGSQMLKWILLRYNKGVIYKKENQGDQNLFISALYIVSVCILVVYALVIHGKSSRVCVDKW